jgi:hypothetical protein
LSPTHLSCVVAKLGQDVLGYRGPISRCEVIARPPAELQADDVVTLNDGDVGYQRAEPESQFAQELVRQ